MVAPFYVSGVCGAAQAAIEFIEPACEAAVRPVLLGVAAMQRRFFAPPVRRRWRVFLHFLKALGRRSMELTIQLYLPFGAWAAAWERRVQAWFDRRFGPLFAWIGRRCNAILGLVFDPHEWGSWVLEVLAAGESSSRVRGEPLLDTASTTSTRAGDSSVDGTSTEESPAEESDHAVDSNAVGDGAVLSPEVPPMYIPAPARPTPDLTRDDGSAHCQPRASDARSSDETTTPSSQEQHEPRHALSLPDSGADRGRGGRAERVLSGAVAGGVLGAGCGFVGGVALAIPTLGLSLLTLPGLSAAVGCAAAVRHEWTKSSVARAT